MKAVTMQRVPQPPEAVGRSREIAFSYSPAILPGIALTLDICLMGVAIWISTLLFADENSEVYENANFLFVFSAFSYVMLMKIINVSWLSQIMNPYKYFDYIVILLFTIMLFYMSIVFSLDVYEDFPARWTVTAYGASAALIMAERFALKQVIGRLARRRVIGSNLAVLGVGEQSRRFLQRLRASEPYFTSVMGVFHAEQGGGQSGSLEGHPVVGGLDDLLALARREKIDDIVVAMPWNADRRVIETVEALKELPVNVYLSADLAGYELAFQPAPGQFATMPLFEVVQRPIAGWSSALKAAEDYVLGGIALLVTAPLLIVIAIAIRLDSPGPVLFKQKRLGFNNREFFIYKFRSMHHNRTADGPVKQATRNDPRVTRVGRFLRATSLDELPQLFNVIEGTMSLVGPRPHALDHNEEYGRQIRGYFARHRVKPGITGWAQVNGLRGETEVIEKMEARIRHDIYYADNWSILFDLRILLMTALVFMFQRTAY